MSGDHNQNQTDSGWRKRQIALNKKADNAREMGLDYEPSIIKQGTSMTQEVLRQALEALTYIYTETTADEDELIHAAITAIKEALAQTQEPVAWINPDEQNARRAFHWVKSEEFSFAVYTAPPQRKPLTDEEIFVIKHNWITTPFANHLDFARAIEAAHGIKENT